MGFNVPIREWSKETIYNYVKDNIVKFNRDTNMFNLDEVNKQLKLLKDGRQRYTNNIWTIYFLINWYKNGFDMKILWISPVFNHYKGRFLNLLARNKNIELSVMTGSGRENEGDKELESEWFLKTISLDVPKIKFGMSLKVMILSVIFLITMIGF